MKRLLMVLVGTACLAFVSVAFAAGDAQRVTNGDPVASCPAGADIFAASSFRGRSRRCGWPRIPTTR